MTRVAHPQFSSADLEFLTQGIDLDPILKRISDFLYDHPKIVKRVRKDLDWGLKNPDTGRCGITAPQVVRFLILMRVKNWDYRELRERIADGYTLRQFTGFYTQRVPKHDAFNRAFNKLRPQTMQAINDLVVNAAVDLGVENGKKLRVDTTVVETDIHHPTDNTLLWDVVRVLTRLIGRRRLNPEVFPRSHDRVGARFDRNRSMNKDLPHDFPGALNAMNDLYCSELRVLSDESMSPRVGNPVLVVARPTSLGYFRRVSLGSTPKCLATILCTKVKNLAPEIYLTPRCAFLVHFFLAYWINGHWSPPKTMN